MLCLCSPTPILLPWLSSSLSSEFIASASCKTGSLQEHSWQRDYLKSHSSSVVKDKTVLKQPFHARATVVCHWHKVLPLRGTHPAAVCAQCPALPQKSQVGLILTPGPLYLTWVLYLQKGKMFYESSMGHLPRKYIGHLKAVQMMLTSRITRWLAAVFLSDEGSSGTWACFRSILSDVCPVQRKAWLFI